MIGILPFRFAVFIAVISATGCASPTTHNSVRTSDGKTKKRSNWIEVGPSSIDSLLIPYAKALKKLDWDEIQSPAGVVIVRNIRNKQGKIVRTEKVSDAELLALRQRQAELTTPTPGNR